jgi:predicted ATP-binding protein involved in virulence
MLQYINTQKIGYRKKRKKKKEKKEKKKSNQSRFMNEEDRIRGMYPTIRRFKGLKWLIT